MNESFREIIQNEIAERTKRNPAYSMRAFAKAAGIKPPQLSAVLNGRKGLSAVSALRVAKALGLDQLECEEFIHQVNAQHSRKRAERKAAETALKKVSKQKAFQTIALENFKLISEWHNFAILHLIELDAFESNTSWISARLGLSESVVSESLALLNKLDLIDVTGERWSVKQKFMTTPNVSSRAIRNNHHQVLKLAGQAIEDQSIMERDFSSIFMSLKRECIPQAKLWLKEFRRSFCHKLDQENKKDALYCLSIQFFEITKNELETK